MKRIKLLILASGRGSHAVNLIQATRDGRIDGTVVRLVSDRADAPALASARTFGVPVTVLEPFVPGPRLAPEAEERLLEIVTEDAPDLIALCGFMRLLRKSFLGRVSSRILNVHPSLLPAFRGLEPQRRAIEAGAGTTGVTVHHVDAGMDTGPIVAQEATPILAGETPEGLAERLLSIEHRLYVQAIQRIQREMT